MVSLKSFKQYFSRQPLTAEEVEIDSALLERLVECFGGRENIQQVDACLTRLRVKVTSLRAVDTAGLQKAGAIGVVILGQEVHASLVRSPTSCVSCWKPDSLSHFSRSKKNG